MNAREIIHKKALSAALFAASAIPVMGCSGGNSTQEAASFPTSFQTTVSCESIFVSPSTSGTIRTFEVNNGLPNAPIAVVENSHEEPEAIPKNYPEGIRTELTIGETIYITRQPKNIVKAEVCTP